MKQFFQYIQTPQRFFAFLFLLLFPLNTVFIYSERFVNGYKWEYGTLAYYGIEVIGWLFVLSLVVPMVRRAKQATVHVTADRKFLLAALLFLLYSFASALWAVENNLAQQQTTLVLLMLLLFVLLPVVLSRREMVCALSIGSLLPIGIGLYQFFSQSLPNSTLLGMSGRAVEEGGVSVVQFGEERWLRAYGTLAHPNVFGGYLAALIVSMLVMLQGRIGKYTRVWYIGMLVCSGVLLILTMSRSAWLATILGVGTLVYVEMKKQKHGIPKTKHLKLGEWRNGIVALGVGMLFATSIAWPLVSVRVTGGSYHEFVSVSERAALQIQAMDVFATSPVVGVGAGNMTAALIEADSSKFGYAYQPVHNVFLLLLVEYGIVGMLLLAGVLYYFVRFVLQQGRGLGVFAAIVVLLPLLVFDHYLWTSVHGLGIAAVYLAILLSPTDPSSRDSSSLRIDE